MSEWKEGDDVAVLGWRRELISIAKIEHVTDTGLIRVRGWHRLFRTDGSERGGEHRIVTPTSEHREHVERGNLRYVIQNAHHEQFARVDLPTLRRMAALLRGEVLS